MLACSRGRAPRLQQQADKKSISIEDLKFATQAAVHPLDSVPY